MITFISGGARSGKSAFAEKSAYHVFQKHRSLTKRLYYFATAEQIDGEMKDRINRHQKQREEDWQTIEVPTNVTDKLISMNPYDVILLDCLTIWLNNMMYKEEADLIVIEREIHKWMEICRRKKLHLFIVSNDVNEGIMIRDYFTDQYIYLLESIHRYFVKEADTVYQVVASLPIKWKG
ncbi:bifunctional adenosylcobinamide kinase/adenosylcobinamide-phosphate guanylyltransferase [Bacillus weihaiensis]|uniref:bifunctional adenosylcobinamide kinase/adenosylcobinamide-phosphate guanylyltransferase n=1 Tax=Bacillus weihaiensis TaxID=1547283 RepID=UPI00235783D6|nr:bifunctional adenosylcobinamide kinase/adenosylcobinamide-phosphate guanylyltransferase [Bacillus weihaiensis]